MALSHPKGPHSPAWQARHKKFIRRRILVGLAALVLLSLLVLGCICLFKGCSKTPAAAPESSSVPIASPEPTPTPKPPFVPTWNTAGLEGFPYLIAVNRQTQTVTVYEKDEAGNYTKPYKSMICSTGTHTPVGEFNTTDQYEWRALEGNVYGQYATRITGHILFHSVPYVKQDKGTLESEEYNKLGTPASLGCVRLCIADCKWIYDECPSGTPVVLYDGDTDTDPLGTPDFEPMDVTSPNAGWDPTDPDPNNPWLAA